MEIGDKIVLFLDGLSWIGRDLNPVKFNNLFFIPVESLSASLGLEVMVMKV
jgi:hypothetical protein